VFGNLIQSKKAKERIKGDPNRKGGGNLPLFADNMLE
jgi:hypothetical protein